MTSSGRLALLCAALLAACGPASAPGAGAPDAGPGGPAQAVALDVSDILAIRGETTAVRVVPHENQQAPAWIAFGPLPPGLSAAPVLWNGRDAEVSLDLVAEPDAAQFAGNVRITAAADGTVEGDSTAQLAVMGAAGSPDPTFGDAGTIALADHIFGFGLLADGGALVVGAASNAAPGTAALTKIRADGSLDDTFGTAGVRLEDLGLGLTSVAVAPDGRVALSGQAPNNVYSIALFDPTGAPMVSQSGFGGAVVGAWDSSGALAVGSDGLVHITPDGVVTTSAVGYFAQRVVAAPDGTVFVGGLLTPSIPFVEKLAPAGGGAYLPVASFGDGGVVAVPADLAEESLFSIAVEATGGVLVGFESQLALDVVRVSSSGIVEDHMSLSAGGPTLSLVPCPSGDFLAVGAFGVRRFSASGDVVTSFGIAGEIPDLAMPTYVVGGALDATRRLWVFGTGGSVAVYRDVAP
jgi:hypothetical protein